MIGEPFPHQIQRASEVARQVHAWKREQTDMVQCGEHNATITLRACVRFQKNLARGVFGLSASRELSLARALYCSRCEHKTPEDGTLPSVAQDDKL